MPSKHAMSYELFSSLYDYNAETGELTSKVYTDSRGRVRGGHVRGSVNNVHGYRSLGLKSDGIRRNYYCHRVAWLLHNGSICPNLTIDHINGDKLDNRIINLRQVTQEVNSYNRTVAIGKLPLGVSLTKGGTKYRARICRKRKEYILGNFNNAKDASKAYLDARKSGVYDV